MVEIEALSYTRTSVDEILAGVSLTVQPGEVLGLLGEPGAGQMELLQVLAGDLIPTAGSVRHGGPPDQIRLLHEPAPTPALRLDLHREAAGGMAVVIATCRATTAHALCDRVAILQQGRLRGVRPAADLAPLLAHEHYQIRLRGHLAARAARWFEGLHLELTPAGETVLTGPVADQSTLHGHLARIRDLGLVLLEVRRCEPPLQLLFA